MIFSNNFELETWWWVIRKDNKSNLQNCKKIANLPTPNEPIPKRASLPEGSPDKSMQIHPDTMNSTAVPTFWNDQMARHFIVHYSARPRSFNDDNPYIRYFTIQGISWYHECSLAHLLMLCMVYGETAFMWYVKHRYQVGGKNFSLDPFGRFCFIVNGEVNVTWRTKSHMNQWVVTYSGFSEIRHITFHWPT